MKKMLFILGSSLLLSGIASAQTVYGSLGYASRSWEGANTGFPGFNVSAAVGFDVADLSGVGVEPRIGFSYASLKAKDGSNDFTLSEPSLNLDVLFKTQVSGFDVYAGPSLNYAFGTQTVVNGGTTTNTSYSGLGFGIVLGGVYSIDSKLGIFVEGGYGFGNLNSNNKNYSSNALSLKLGVAYNF